MANGWQSSEAKSLQQEAIDERRLNSEKIEVSTIQTRNYHQQTFQQVLAILVTIFQAQLDAQFGQQRISLFFLVVHDGIENL
jgi:hypothetical protein